MHRGDCAHERVSYHQNHGLVKRPSCPVVTASNFHTTDIGKEPDPSNIDNRFVTHVCLYLKHAVTDSTRDTTRFASLDHYRTWRGRRPECPLVRVERKCMKKLELRQAHLTLSEYDMPFLWNLPVTCGAADWYPVRAFGLHVRPCARRTRHLNPGNSSPGDTTWLFHGGIVPMPSERRLQCLCFWPIFGHDTAVSFTTALPRSVLFDRRKACRQSQDDIQVLSAVDWATISKQVFSRFHKLPPLCFVRKCSIPPTWFSVFTICFPAFSGMCALAEAVGGLPRAGQHQLSSDGHGKTRNSECEHHKTEAAGRKHS